MRARCMIAVMLLEIAHAFLGTQPYRGELHTNKLILKKIPSIFPCASFFKDGVRDSAIVRGGQLTVLDARGRGLEIQTEGATPTVGGMTLFLKSGPSGDEVGDCPFAHYVRIVLHEKDLPYELRPCTAETKPSWLVNYYEGKMPALRHRSECYVESDVIAEYLDFFFQDPKPLLPPKNKRAELESAKELAGAVFPAVAKYFKHTSDGDSEDEILKKNLETVLSGLEVRLNSDGRSGPFLVGNGEMLTLVDCSLIPKLYHMVIGLEHFKGKPFDFEVDFPNLKKYMDTMTSRDSFKKSLYPAETVIWGWTNARNL